MRRRGACTYAASATAAIATDASTNDATAADAATDPSTEFRLAQQQHHQDDHHDDHRDGHDSASPSSSTTKTTGTTITRATGMVLTATTALVSPVLAGSQELVVESEEGFSVGDTIVITGGGNSETRDIASFGSIVLDAPLDYGYPAGSSITKLGGSYSSTAPWAEEQQDSERLLTVFVGVVIVLLACTALGLGCLMRRGCPGRGRGPAHDRGMRDAQIEISVSELDAEIDEHQPDQKDELPETM
ncbi:unnamed protein product [Prorocentrum cordatum]|uniref:Subtilisin n=1 Tax=Prorocentrum cordatum TaxID=2364126 RepID=A0ABN9RBD3_9DINO|nr:unnamed protein product [Polarella glacialis]